MVGNLEKSMIENRAQPSCGHPSRVAGNARCGIVRRDVIRHVHAVILRVRVVRLMAAVTVRGRVARGVVATDVAVCAGIHHRANRACDRSTRGKHVGTLQGEPRRSMVELTV